VIQLLSDIAVRFSPAALASSLSAEDMVLTDAIARAGLPIEVFVLDTGRLHAADRGGLGSIPDRRRHQLHLSGRIHGPGFSICD
jgi:phosphoadenosine phosphosulfate reductase